MLHLRGPLKEVITAELPTTAPAGPGSVLRYSSNTYNVSLGNFGSDTKNDWAYYCVTVSHALLHSTWWQKTFSQLFYMDADSVRFSLFKAKSTVSWRDTMNSPIRDTKAEWNSFAGLRRPAPGIPSPYDQNQMLRVTNMASQLRAAQRTPSCLLGPAAENYRRSGDNAAPVSKGCSSHQAAVRQVAVRLAAVNLCNSCRKRCGCGTRALLQRGSEEKKSVT